VVPDLYLLGKALGGGVVPLSAVVADREVLGVLHPGEHGSTFGGNPFAAAIGTTVVAMLTAANSRTARHGWGHACTGGWKSCSAEAWLRCADADYGPASTSTRRSAAPNSSACGLPNAVSW
jgi:adenosylmethionine-8-amino-7-oxononanoate aminotransferase